MKGQRSKSEQEFLPVAGSLFTELVTSQKLINYSKVTQAPLCPVGGRAQVGSSLPWEGVEALAVTCTPSSAQEVEDESLCVLGQGSDSQLQLHPDSGRSGRSSHLGGDKSHTTSCIHEVEAPL